MLKTASGKEFAADGVLFSPYLGYIHILFTDGTEEELRAVCNDPSEMETLIFNDGKKEKEYKGYTNFVYIMQGSESFTVTMSNRG